MRSESTMSAELREALRARGTIVVGNLEMGDGGLIVDGGNGCKPMTIGRICVESLPLNEAYAIAAIWIAAGDALAYIQRLAVILDKADGLIDKLLAEGDEMPIDEAAELRHEISLELTAIHLSA